MKQAAVVFDMKVKRAKTYFKLLWYIFIRNYILHVLYSIFCIFLIFFIKINRNNIDDDDNNNNIFILFISISMKL